MSKHLFVIVGGGFSGLSFASKLKKRNINSFVLIEKSPSNIGGYSSLGGVKIGFLPAGEKTANYLSLEKYEKFCNMFTQDYGLFFSNEIQKKKEFDFYEAGVENKYYNSPILEMGKMRTILNSLEREIRDNILYSQAISISKINGNNYCLTLENGETIVCENLIIASGRDESIYKCMLFLNEEYYDTHSLLIGCRACFTPDSALKLFNHQHDFKVKSRSNFQTYCFNYKGNLHKIYYMGRQFFAGSYNNSIIGNVFIGKRIETNILSAINYFPRAIQTSPENLHETFKLIKDVKYEAEFHDFITILEKQFDLKFISFNFPALEQFWPQPKLKSGTLESNKLENVYYIGDASGISFGVLQCYVTANFVIEEINKKYGIY